jgi:hypothetical protein
MTEDNLLDPPERDAINPSHYKSHPSGIECIEISKHLSGCLAQAFQYVWRCGQKDDPIQELDKAIWFINAELTIGKPVGVSFSVISMASKVCDHESCEHRAKALGSIAVANGYREKREAMLKAAIVAIEYIKEEIYAKQTTCDSK